MFFTLQQELENYGVWYLILLGVAVLAAVWMRGGVWATLARRVPVQLFPVQRRVRVAPSRS